MRTTAEAVKRTAWKVRGTPHQTACQLRSPCAVRPPRKPLNVPLRAMTALLMAAMAGCGLPGFANFVGEVTVFFGAWKVFPLVTGLALWGALLIGALYMLRAVRNILHGPLPEKWNSIPDASNVWRKLPYALLLASLFVFGIWPRLLTEKITPDAQKIVSMANPDTGTPGGVAISEIHSPQSSTRN